MDAPWGIALDYANRLLPAVSIIVPALVARQQIVSNRHASAITIAKNHYKDLLYLFEKNVDILYGGLTEASPIELRKDIYNYRRYRWLVTIMLFSLQELFVELGDKPQWRRTIFAISSLFKAFLLSPTELPDFIRRGWGPDFMKVIMDGLHVNEHPAAQGQPGPGHATPIRIELVRP